MCKVLHRCGKISRENVSPELRERHGRVEAGEDGDGVELSGVPHKLGLIVHSDNLAGVYLDKTAMNKWKASTIYYGFPFNIMLRKYKSNDQTSPELTSTSTNFQSKPESNSDKAASDTTWFLLSALIVNIQAPTWLGLASSGDQQQAKEKRNQFGHCYVLYVSSERRNSDCAHWDLCEC